MPRAAKRDPLGTERRCFLDPLSFVSNDGREFLAGEDVSVRRHEVFERSGGFCEEPGCNREIDEHLPTEHPNAFHMHHLKHKGKGGSDNFTNLQAACTRCHKRHHASRNPQWRGSKNFSETLGEA
jgi:5-methylcytosine-specific restriction endonuclease McrA